MSKVGDVVDEAVEDDEDFEIPPINFDDSGPDSDSE